jgi:hypothetical protein
MRGRRVALLLTGLWPLLAKYDVPATETNVTIETSENENALPSEDDTLQQLPKLPLNTLLTTNPSNIVMVEPVFDDEDLLDDVVVVVEESSDGIIDDSQHVETTDNDEALDDTRQQQREPPIVEEVEQIQNQHVSSSDEPKDVPASGDEPETNAAQVNEDESSSSSSPEPSEVDDASEEQVESSTETEEQESSQEESESPQVRDEGDNETSAEEATPDESSSKEQDEEDDDDDVTDRVLVDYASKSAGALILEKSPDMKGASNLLNGDNDKYAIVPCSEKKFVVINLSEDILVKQVKLANYERFSSHLKDFQIMGSQTMGEWVDLGTYTAEPGNGEQAFDLKEPEWARYLKFKFLTHHGSEHYCTYSQIKVHGSTMLQGFHEQWDSQEDSDDGSQEGEADAETAKPGDRTEASSDGGDDASKEGESSSEAKTDASENQGKGDETIDGPSEVSDESPSESSASGEGTGDASGDEPSKDNEGDEIRAKSADHKQVTDDNSPSSADADDEGTVDAKREAGNKQGLVVDHKPTLSTASVPVSSHDAVVSERTGSTEQLNTFAIKPAEQSLKEVVSSVVKEMVAAEAFMSLKDAQSVSDEVKDIQESLKTAAIIPGATKVEANADGTEERDPVAETGDPSADERSEAKITASAETPVENEAASGSEPDSLGSDNSTVEKNVQNDGGDGKSLEGSSSSKDISQDSAAHDTSPQNKFDQGQAKSAEAADESLENKNSQVGVDPVFGNIIARFPSAECLSNLDFQDFKAKIVASRANSQGGHPSGHGGSKMEPIFKLLTDEIKGLQMSQSVQDQYMKALISCYQQVMMEMADTLSKVETQQEKRLSNLEQAMDAAQSGSFKRVLAAITAVVSTCILGTQLAYQAIASSLETLVDLGLMNDMTTALFVLGVCSLALMTIGYCICAVRSRDSNAQPSTMKKFKADNDSSEKGTDTGEEGATKKTPATAKPPNGPTKMSPVSVAPDIVVSENESDKSDSATVPTIAWAPRPEKRQTPEYEPDLIPAE